MVLDREQYEATLRLFQERLILFVEVNITNEAKTEVLDGFILFYGLDKFFSEIGLLDRSDESHIGHVICRL